MPNKALRLLEGRLVVGGKQFDTNKIHFFTGSPLKGMIQS